MPSRLISLGNVLKIRFEYQGVLADIEDAILYLRNGVELTPDDDPHKPSRLSNTGNALKARFERFRNFADLNDAISSQRKAVELMPDSHPEKGSILNNLGTAVKARFELLGNVADIEEAILYLREAVKLTPDAHSSIPNCLFNLGNALLAQFSALRNVPDVEDAVLSLRMAVERTPDGHPALPSRLISLGSALQARFQCLKSFSDIEDAISNQRKAAELIPDNHGHIDKPSHLNHLGSALHIRFVRFGDRSDIEDAISSLRKAVGPTPNGHRDKPSLLNNLANALRRRYKLFENLADIEEAIASLRNAVALAPDGHSNIPQLFNNIAGALIDRFDKTSIQSDIEDAVSSLQEAVATLPDGPPRTRFDAAVSWAGILKKHFPSTSSLPAFRHAIDLLPQIAWVGLSIVDQHSLLADVGDLAREAVATAIQEKEYKRAVEWAEQGRSIVWQNLLGLRTPVDDLRREHPELADRFDSISDQLEVPLSQTDHLTQTPTMPLTDVAQKYSLLAIQRETIIDEIRSVPGFKTFMRAKTFAELAPAASEGAVVILNSHEARCDALVLKLDESKGGSISVINIPLKDFTSAVSAKLQHDLRSLLRLARVRARDTRKSERDYVERRKKTQLVDILRELWLNVTKPIIDNLAYQVTQNELPRIWWSATGSLSFLPIHAAGMYGMEGSESCVSDYVVSSYTPTLTAILDQTQRTTSTEFRILTVSQPATPYATPIPMTENEVELIKQYTKYINVVNLSSEHATVKSVLEGMKTSNWIHLACHGEQNIKEPMKSGFLLHDRILELSMIVHTTLPTTDFAFLSACQTAVGDEKIADESVHLAAGMLLAGCRGVIATMWSIEDEDAPTVTEEVYSRILKDGVPNRKAAARALQEGVARLKKSGASFLSWVPYIHIGR
ncbi:hypothetical protein M408DRAFT_324656 [Serendipita vermifera MAFF 305830]|uniref:CHAT domain-containing protein n=1 Tax=Serendipita vermifera MAFF 305830 TaxID=933852 RepID=A0A0C3ARJ9_SERVB|nr:hypothetical protein M408DRAFT_324656 [Serendipita vermifera MAFF 305830]